MEQYDLALIAHDAKKEDIVLLSRAYKEVMAGFSLVATRNTGRMVQQATGLSIRLVQSTQEGGAQQIGAMVASSRVKAVIFLSEHMTTKSDEVDRLALMRICDALNIPFATNTATAKALLHHLSEERKTGKKNLIAASLAETLAGIY